MTSKRIPMGVSGCLIGEQVRYDMSHKKNRFVVDVLGDYAEWFSVCPEVEAGLGLPRETMRIVNNDDGTRMVGNRSSDDYTIQVRAASAGLARYVKRYRLRGFVLKSGSPTCGMDRVRTYDGNGVPNRNGVGLFAQKLMRDHPSLPIEEEDRLNDPRIRENFITRVFAYDRWLRLRGDRPKFSDVVAFHEDHRMLLLAHSPQTATELGSLVAKAGSLELHYLLETYEAGFMMGLKTIASPGRHANVLKHLAGFLKNDLGKDDKAELNRIIDDYRGGRVPLVVPLVLLTHHIQHLRDDWLHAQRYLSPYPAELALRSAV